MMKLLVALLIFAAPASANTVIGFSGSEGTRYLRTLDIRHPQFAVVSLFNVRDRAVYGALTDVALLTHSTADGTLVPKALQGVLPPSAWVPLQAGIGGSLSNRVIIHLGTSYNVGSTLASSIVTISGLSYNPTAQAIKKLMSDGLEIGKAGDLGFYVGIGLAGELVSDGHFQSIKGMFPGEGFGDILQNASKYSIGLTFRPK